MKKEEMRIVFMGTPDFAVPSLEALLEAGFPVVGVVTAPDKPAGRGKKITPPPIKTFALSRGLKVLQPPNLKASAFLEELQALEAKLQVVVAFRMLPRSVWDMPPLGTFNLHASLLPQYRGAAPINHAIINGERRTGLTTFFLDEAIDTGSIIKQVEMEIGPEEDAGSLHDRMMLAGARLVVETAELIRQGRVEPVPQDKLLTAGEELRPAPKISKAFCRIDWNRPVEQIFNFVRGLSPYPAAFGVLHQGSQEKPMKIFRVAVEKEAHGLPVGTVHSDGKNLLKVAAGDGFVQLLELQPAGKKRMGIAEYLRGNPVENGAVMR